MRVRLRGTTWVLQRVDLGASIRGEIDPPTYSKRRIKISTRLKKDKDVLEVLLHECLHGCFWELDEATVERAAEDIAKLLYKLGARIDLTNI